jgi:hypothetical protein
MRVKFKLEKRESEFIKQQFFTSVTKILGPKAMVDRESVEVDDKDEAKVLEILRNIGLKYEKTA